jgi:cytosine/adenosine deaminase-related metal-dependent hydrolase
VDSEIETGTLILPDYLIDQPGAAVKSGWGVRLLGAVVADVGPHNQLRAQYGEDEHWYAPNQVLSPGFVDANVHPPALLTHGMPRPQHLTEENFWRQFWWPTFLDRLDQGMVTAALESACFHALHSGVTTLAVHMEAPQTLPNILPTLAEILDEWGMRATLAYVVSTRAGVDIDLSLAENESFQGACVESCRFPRVRASIAVDCTAGAKTEVFAQVQRWAETNGALLQIHRGNAESVLHQDGELRRVYTPITEVQFASEKLERLTLDNGDKVGLGSDGTLLDFFRIMRSAQRQSRAGDHHQLSAAQIWYLATEGGAQALGLEKVGRLAPGWQADLQLIEAIFPAPATVDNLYDQLLRYGSSEQIQSVLIGGEMRVSGGVVLGVDAPSVRQRAHHAAKRLWKLATEG